MMGLFFTFKVLLCHCFDTTQMLPVLFLKFFSAAYVSQNISIPSISDLVELTCGTVNNDF